MLRRLKKGLDNFVSIVYCKRVTTRKHTMRTYLVAIKDESIFYLADLTSFDKQHTKNFVMGKSLQGNPAVRKMVTVLVTEGVDELISVDSDLSLNLLLNHFDSRPKEMLQHARAMGIQLYSKISNKETPC